MNTGCMLGRHEQERHQPPDLAGPSTARQQGDAPEVEPGHQRQAPEKDLPDDEVEREVRNRKTSERRSSLVRRDMTGGTRRGSARTIPQTRPPRAIPTSRPPFAGSWSSSFCFWLSMLIGHGSQQEAGVIELLLLDQDVGGLKADGLLLEPGRTLVFQRAPDLERLVPIRVRRDRRTTGRSGRQRRSFSAPARLRA
jgi:hypothetical protein